MERASGEERLPFLWTPKRRIDSLNFEFSRNDIAAVWSMYDIVTLIDARDERSKASKRALL